MPHWLVQDPSLVYFLLVVAAIGLGFACWTTRRGKYAIALVGVVALIMLVWLLDRNVITEHEKMVADLRVMAGAVERRDLDAIFERISTQFRMGRMDRQGFRDWCRQRMTRENITDVRVWDFLPAEVDEAAGTAQIQFMVKGDGNWVRGHEFFRCRAFFVRDPDGEWRMRGFELFEPAKDPKLAEPIPLPF